MRNECEDAERRHRSRNQFLDDSPSFSQITCENKRKPNICRLKLSKLYIPQDTSSAVSKQAVCMGWGEGILWSQSFWNTACYIHQMYQHHNAHQHVNGPEKVCSKQTHLFGTNSFSKYMCPQTITSPIFMSPENTYAWNSLGNSSLELLLLNFQLIITEMRIRFVKQAR